MFFWILNDVTYCTIPFSFFRVPLGFATYRNFEKSCKHQAHCCSKKAVCIKWPFSIHSQWEWQVHAGVVGLTVERISNFKCSFHTFIVIRLWLGWWKCTKPIPCLFIRLWKMWFAFFLLYWHILTALKTIIAHTSAHFTDTPPEWQVTHFEWYWADFFSVSGHIGVIRCFYQTRYSLYIIKVVEEQWPDMVYVAISLFFSCPSFIIWALVTVLQMGFFTTYLCWLEFALLFVKLFYNMYCEQAQATNKLACLWHAHFFFLLLSHFFSG